MPHWHLSVPFTKERAIQLAKIQRRFNQQRHVYLPRTSICFCFQGDPTKLTQYCTVKRGLHEYRIEQSRYQPQCSFCSSRGWHCSRRTRSCRATRVHIRRSPPLTSSC